jgi:hypothetical protein
MGDALEALRKADGNVVGVGKSMARQKREID